jgi:calcineurin-like phosphoesterase family protein
MLAEYKKAGFIEILPSSYCIQYKGQFIRLSHFPTKDVTKDYHSVKHLEQRPDDTGILNLCGHVHIEWLKRDNNINVGVDVTDFKPVLLDDMIELWKNGPENINTPNKVRIALWKAYHTVRHWLFGKKKGK